MSLAEKCSMLSGGKTFATRGYKRYGIPAMELSDGPHGLRKQGEGANHLGLGGSLPATCFPTAATVANSWNPKLGEEVGEALGEEAKSMNVGVILGPGLNMKRSPLCGRNFEYFSEDPYLAGKMAAGYIRGIQKTGVSACPKHFAANNQELKRMASDSIVDERTLREIYLTAFEIAVKEGNPKTIMTSYNLINGFYANENSHLLKDILRDEWKFDGMVVTDWGGSNSHVEGVRCGSALEMPAPGGGSTRELVRAVKEGRLSENIIDDRLNELLEIIMTSDEALKNSKKEFDKKAHHDLARRVAAESIVLLKNENNILPLRKNASVALIGDFAKTPRYQGAGSSLVNPTELSSMTDKIGDYELNIAGFATGYKRHGGSDKALLNEATALASKADIVIYCMGLDEIKESEGLDRSDMKIDENQIEVLHAIAGVNPNVVVVLSGGSAVEMPWLSDCKGLIDTYLSGQAGAEATLDVLTGKINPSGKLSESFPMQYSDSPVYGNYPSHARTSEYREGMYIGYRYYDTANIEVQFPFGFGLSYTEFKYSDISVNENGVTFTITNTGSMEGSEIAELYAHRHNNNSDKRIIPRPERELKGFTKVYLKAGESKTVTIPFDDKTFRFFDIKENKWETEAASWEIQVGASSRDIRLKVDFESLGDIAESPLKRGSIDSYYAADVKNVSDTEFAALLGHALPSSKIKKIDENITFGELIHGRSPIFWLVWLVLTILLKISLKRGKPDLNILFIYNMPLRALAKMTGGGINMSIVKAFTLEVKGGWIVGFIWFIVEAVRNIINNARLEAKLASD